MAFKRIPGVKKERLAALSFVTLRAASIGYAATITSTPRAVDDRYVLYIHGKIAAGDYKKLVATIRQREEFPYVVSISSPGGNMAEAMAIGRLLRKGLVTVEGSSIQCNSACALIVFASRINFGDAKLGIHRPSYRDEYFAGLSFEEAQEKMRALESDLRSYLKEMDVPADLADKMMSVPSNDMFYLDMSDYRELVGLNPPAVFEWLKARCGAFDPAEAHDFADVVRYRNYESFMKIGAERTASLYRDGAQRAARLPPGYRE